MTHQGPFLTAVVAPWAAYVIARDYGAQIERHGRVLAATRGTEVLGEQMLAAVAQMREAGRQRFEAHQALASTSGVGRAAVPIAPVEAASSSEGVLRSGLTTREVAERFGFAGPRQVINLIEGGRLSATLVGGQWLVDEVSVAKEIERRSTG